MTPAEYDTRRRLLGLSVEEAAALHGVADRTIRRWTRGEWPVPNDAAQSLGRLEDAMAGAVAQAAELARAKAEGRVLLWRYRTKEALEASPHARSLPLGAHAILIGWTADALEEEGFDVEIAWAD